MTNKFECRAKTIDTGDLSGRIVGNVFDNKELWKPEPIKEENPDGKVRD